jgi:phosphatidylglycerol:prolipoprotein diacylglycerol transferase
VHPTLFHIGSVAVHSYGTLLMLGFIAGILLCGREAKRLKLPDELAVDLGLWVLVGSIVGARGLFVALNWGDFAARPQEALFVWQTGGLSFHGGLLGGIIAALLLGWRRKISFWAIADMAAPGIALGYGIARIGCFLNGCCYGAPVSPRWSFLGVRFPLYPDSGIMTEPSHPTQLYSAAGSFLILAILLWVRPRFPVRGQLFLVYIGLYSILRSAVEVLRRGYTAQVAFDGVTQAQALSAVLFAAAIFSIVRLGRKSRREPSEARKGAV